MMTLYYKYRPINTLRDHEILQEDLNAMIERSNDWMMEFNISKCNPMQVTTNHNVSSFFYKMCNTATNLSWEP